MRPSADVKNRAQLHAKVGLFAQPFRTLIVPSKEVLADTVLVLQNIVSISNKVLPLKCYFNVVQDTQRTNYLAERLALEETNDMRCETPEDVLARDAKMSQLKAQFLAKGSDWLVKNLQRYSRVVDPEAFIQMIDQNASQQLATEDVFMLACSYMSLSIAKQGSVHYLCGQSPEFKETKKNRAPINLKNETALKDLSSALGRPDANRGKVERTQILSGFNHLVKLNNLAIMAPSVAQFMRTPKRDGSMPRNVDALERFSLTLLDFQRISAMARRSGLLDQRSTKRDPDNHYELRANNHKRVIDHAEYLGVSTGMALNRILDAFFSQLDIERRKERQRLVVKTTTKKPARGS